MIKVNGVKVTTETIPVEITAQELNWAVRRVVMEKVPSLAKVEYIKDGIKYLDDGHRKADYAAMGKATEEELRVFNLLEEIEKLLLR